MRDPIERQDAIDAILHNQEVYSNNFGDDPIDRYTIAIIDNDAQTIAQLPSAQSEPNELNLDCDGCYYCGKTPGGLYVSCALCARYYPDLYENRRNENG